MTAHNSELHAELKKIAESKGILKSQRHLLLCAGDKCCAAADGDRIWDYLKFRLAEFKATGPSIMRTKAKCLRICKSGPILLVYPDGIWYYSVNERAVDRIISEHIVGGKPVSELMFLENPLT